MSGFWKAKVAARLEPDECIIRCRAPLRLGLAGGGTDLSPFCDDYGGTVLNATITRYAFTSIEPRHDGQVHFISNDLNEQEILDASDEIDPGFGLRLHRAVYNRFTKLVGDKITTPLSLTLTTSVDCPMGAGLGASSALTVSMIGAYRTWLELPMSDFELAHLAYEVERLDLSMSGGRQDQYAATFGGINFMEFTNGERVVINPISLERRVIHELEASLMLCFTGTARVSSQIIDQQVSAVQSRSQTAVDAMHQLKRDALEMKAALLREELELIPSIINRSWAAKKRTAENISSAAIDELYNAALRSGALAGKISGAGGGGFLMLLVDPVRRASVQSSLERLGAVVSSCTFTHEGVFGWRAPRICTKIEAPGGC